jgi:Protein of unknown function (DUF4236)
MRLPLPHNTAISYRASRNLFLGAITVVQYRKSKKVGPVRFTASKRGISTSVGYGPFRVTRRADGRYQRTARLPGTGIRDTRVIGGQRQAPASAQANILVQLGKLFLCFLALGFILSVFMGSLAGFAIVGGIFLAVFVGIAIWLVVAIRRRRQGQ